MIQSGHVKTTTYRLETRLESASHRCRSHRYPAIESPPSRVAARLHWHHYGTDGLAAGSWTGLSASPATTISPEPPGTFAAPQEMGWTAPHLAERGRGRSVSGSVGRTGPAGRSSGRFSSAGGAGGEVGPENCPLGSVPSLGATRVAKSRARYTPPEKRSGGPGGVEKNSPKRWQPC
jgi:hypothetical protein